MSESSPERVTLASLAPLPCWVAWQTELREAVDKKPTKVPRNPRTGVEISVEELPVYEVISVETGPVLSG